MSTRTENTWIKYRVDGCEYCDIDDVLAHIEENVSDSEFHDWLDEAYGEVNIAGCEYLTSDVLKEIDPVNYRCLYADYIDALKEDWQERIEILTSVYDDGITVYGSDITVIGEYQEDKNGDIWAYVIDPGYKYNCGYYNHIYKKNKSDEYIIISQDEFDNQEIDNYIEHETYTASE